MCILMDQGARVSFVTAMGVRIVLEVAPGQRTKTMAFTFVQKRELTFFVWNIHLVFPTCKYTNCWTVF